MRRSITALRTSPKDQPYSSVDPLEVWWLCYEPGGLADVTGLRRRRAVVHTRSPALRPAWPAAFVTVTAAGGGQAQCRRKAADSWCSAIPKGPGNARVGSPGGPWWQSREECRLSGQSGLNWKPPKRGLKIKTVSLSVRARSVGRGDGPCRRRAAVRGEASGPGPLVPSPKCQQGDGRVARRNGPNGSCESRGRPNQSGLSRQG